MAEIQNQELFNQLRFKLLNNNIYFRVFQDIVFENSDLPVHSGADLIISGLGLKNTSDDFNFIVIYRDKIEDDSKEDDDFGLVKANIKDLIEKLKKKEISAYHVDKRSPDEEIENILAYV